ncbi:MAG: hypothetical protein WCZ89_00970 [Phycisphaerae bacterium]
MADSQIHNVQDSGNDILSHHRRDGSIHILTLDKSLADDVYDRIHGDKRTRAYRIIKPQNDSIKDGIAEIEAMAAATTNSKLIIFDVRRSTLPTLQQVYNKVVGYNRRDFNKLCYTILIGDGPLALFQTDKCLDLFHEHLSRHRADYYHSVFFFDPFLHYEPDEITSASISYSSIIQTNIPKRLAPYFKGQTVKIDDVRRYFRAAGKPKEIKQKRLKMLNSVYKKGIEEQFPDKKQELQALLSKDGILLSTEKLNLYPLFFEDWVFELIQKTER